MMNLCIGMMCMAAVAIGFKGIAQTAAPSRLACLFTPGFSLLPVFSTLQVEAGIGPAQVALQDVSWCRRWPCRVILQGFVCIRADASALHATMCRSRATTEHPAAGGQAVMWPQV